VAKIGRSSSTIVRVVRIGRDERQVGRVVHFIGRIFLIWNDKLVDIRHDHRKFIRAFFNFGRPQFTKFCRQRRL
jgi:hypothetical protein